MRLRVSVLLRFVVLAALLMPFTGTAQQPAKTWRVGVLANEPWPPLDGLKEGLRRSGYVEGRNLQIEYRWFEGRQERLPGLAADLINLKVDVIVTVGTPTALAAKKATTSIPIVMGLIGDPVGAGLVSNIARPGGNITGVSVLAAELEPKRLELLREFLPAVSSVAVLWNPKNPYGVVATKHAQAGAKRLGLRLDLVGVGAVDELDRALEALVRLRPGAVLIVADQLLLTQRARIAEVLVRNRIPAASTYREHAEAGGLFSYSTNYHEAFQNAATYVDRIFKGASAADLPIEQVSRFALVVNAKTVRTLGLSISSSMRMRVDQVIE